MTDPTTRAEEGASLADARAIIADLERELGVTGTAAVFRKALALAKEAAAESRAASAEAEVKRLKARLEIDHAYDGAGNQIPFPAGMEADLDGIACRNETIRQQDDQIAKLTAERDEARASDAESLALYRNCRDRLEASASALKDRVAVLESMIAMLLIAFHDATRRPLGVTPDSGTEFYDPRMADEAEERRAAGTIRSVLRRLPPEEAAARAAALADAIERARRAAHGGSHA